MSRNFCCFGLVLLGLWVAGCKPAAAPENAPSTIVLLTIDTLRADRVSFAGYSEKTTPFLDSLAAEGAVFTGAYAPSSWTPLSMASLFTSLYPRTHGVTYSAFIKEKGYPRPVMSQDLVTLAEVLKGAGYRTIGVPSNVHLSEKLGFSQGFDHYFRQAAMMPGRALNAQVNRQMVEAFGPNWRETWRKEPVFLWVHYLDPHSPYAPYEPWVRPRSPELLSPFTENPSNLHMEKLLRLPRTPEMLARTHVLYDSEIARVDALFQDLWKELRLDSSVLLMMTSDHGEEFNEHRDLDHAKTLYEEVVRVPLFVRWPGHIPAGRTISAPVAMVDLMPTLLDFASIPLPGGSQGRSLKGILQQPDLRLEPRPILFELYRPGSLALTGIRSGSWKLIRKAAAPDAAPQGPDRAGKIPDGRGQVSLFNLEDDPGEQKNLYTPHPRELARLARELDQTLGSLPTSNAPAVQVVPDESTMQQLRTLGYVTE